MASKVLYLGNGKWCWTKNCSQHAREIKLVEAYKEASSRGDMTTRDRVIQALQETPVGKSALNRVRVEEFQEMFGRAPNIGTDLDNTVGDFTQGMRMYTGKVMNIPQEQWLDHFPEPDDYAMWKGERAWFSSSEHFSSIFRAAEQDGIYLKMPSYEEAPETLRELSNLGFRIKGVTARDFEWGDHSREWLAARTINVDDVFHTGHEKEKVPDIDLYLEDSPEVIERLVTHNKRVAIHTQDYNAHIADENPNVSRFNDWENGKVTDIVFELLEKAKEQKLNN